MDDIRVLVSIDFGTTYSGFAYVHKENQETVVVNNSWPGKEGVPKAPTALQYDNGYKNVTSWGNLALEEDPDEEPDDTERQRPRPVELFKLHISNLRKKELPWLPSQLHYTKAIEDYITQMRKLIQVTLERRWPTINFPQQVGFVLTIPAEWPPHTTKVMRECVYKAGLLTSLSSQQLEFTTEPEAAALHCLSVIKEHNLQPNDSFLVADCGGGTVDLTLRKLLPENNNVFVPIIAVPAVPIAAIVRGAITYGLNVDKDIVPDRVLKWTYGIEGSGDKPSKRTKDGMYLYFHELARRGSNVKVDQKFSGDFYPIRPNQDIITFNVYYTSKYEAKYCNDPGMRLLGVIKVKTYDTHLGLNRPIEFSLAFGKVEIKATAKNKSTGEIYNETTLELTL
ncbi:unnamed protein product [Rhizophagus irregularis]|nr:unnamed protein product [Rhizophagus irregularis]